MTNKCEETWRHLDATTTTLQQNRFIVIRKHFGGNSADFALYLCELKNSYLSSVLPVDSVTYIMTNITFFLLKSAFIARHETRNFKLPWDIFGDDVVLERTSKSVMLGMPSSCPECRACQTKPASRLAYPACQTGRAKTGNETSARREIWDLSLAWSILGCEGMNRFFFMSMRCYFYRWSP